MINVLNYTKYVAAHVIYNLTVIFETTVTYVVFETIQ